jgi:putative nucleotidyltransferase with HDIG domain
LAIFPDLAQLDTETKGHKNNFYHTMGVLKNVCDMNNDYKMKIVALFHDIGKLKTRRKIEGKDWTFHNHEIVGAEMTSQIFYKMGMDDAKLADYVYRMIYFHGRTKIHRDVSESAIRRITKEVGMDILPDLIDFCKCDITTSFDHKRKRVVTALDTIKTRVYEVMAKDEDDKWRSPLTGNIIMEILGVGKGRVIGDIKKKYDPLFKSNEITLEKAIEEISKNKNNWLKN